MCLLILCGIGFYIFSAGAAKAEITINGKTYEMRTISVRDFMSDGYVFSSVNYSGAELEAKSYYTR